MATNTTYKIPGSKKIQRQDIPVFTRLFSAMLDAGMPLVQVLDTLSAETNNKAFQPVILGLKDHIEGGQNLSEAMTHYPTLFDDLYLSMIQAGESSGMLSDIGARLADYLEEAQGLRRKVTSALMYPTIVSLIAIIHVTAMMLFVIPAFDDIYKDFGAPLPAYTQGLIDISKNLKDGFVFVFGGIVVCGLLFNQYKKTPAGAYAIDRLKLKLPMFGNLIRKVSLARFAATFSELTRAGVPILRSLEIVASATANEVLKKAVLDARPEVETGRNISDALSECPEFPKLIIQMMSAGEKSGKVDEMMIRISAIYKDEVDATVSGLTSLIEPLLIVFLGVVVGGIVIGMFLPIFKMSTII